MTEIPLTLLVYRHDNRWHTGSVHLDHISSFENLSWLASSFFIASPVSQPIAGRFTNTFSRRAGPLAFNACFGTRMILCGFAKPEWMNVTSGVVAGFSGGRVVATSLFVESYPVLLRKKKGLVQSIDNIAYNVGAGLDGLFDGWISGT